MMGMDFFTLAGQWNTVSIHLRNGFDRPDT